MPSSLNGTGVTFNDGTQLNSRNEAGGNYVRKTFTAPATYVKPAGLKAVKISIIAGGGGGAGTSTIPTSYTGRVGGTGGKARSLSSGFVAASSIPGPVVVTVGAGGAGGPPAPAPTFRNSDGKVGGTSSFGSFLSATGGGGGTGFNVGTPGKTGALGGLATGPALTLSHFEASEYGQPGGTLTPGPGLGTPGTGRGAGGGGSRVHAPAPTGQKAGAAGSGGIVIVEEFF